MRDVLTAIAIVIVAVAWVGWRAALTTLVRDLTRAIDHLADAIDRERGAPPPH